MFPLQIQKTNKISDFIYFINTSLLRNHILKDRVKILFPFFNIYSCALPLILTEEQFFQHFTLCYIQNRTGLTTKRMRCQEIT